MKSKSEILETVTKLLNAPDCVVRVQRELTPDIHSPSHPPDPDKFVIGKRVTIIIVGTQP